MPGSVIVGGARTPIGKLSGALKDIPAVGLGEIAISAALHKAGITGDQVEYVIMGQVSQAGTGQITARQAAAKGGIPMTVPAITVNKVCRSGLNAIALDDQLIGYGEFDVVVAGGMESMTQGPTCCPALGPDTATATLRLSTQHCTTRCSARSTNSRWAPPPSSTARQGNHSQRAGYVRGDEPRASYQRAQERAVR
jgi:acetyl-CoA C-acetyltransferase